MSIQRNEWIFERVKNVLNDKDYLIKSLITQMLNKTTTMFKYKNLPETIHRKELETYLQVGGFGIMKDVKEDLYVFSGGLGGKPNPYYLPTIATVANPALNYSATLEIDKECVVILNDYYYQGLMPLLNKYCSLLTEAEITLKMAILNARVPALIQADNDNTRASAELFFEKIVRGEEYGIIGSNECFEGIKSHDFYKQAYIKDTIESIQYIKGSMFNEIGLNAAFNMKREAINEAEATLNEEILRPFSDIMYECRCYGLEKTNKMFGTNISVEFDSVWAQSRTHDDLAIKLQKAEINDLNKDDDSEVIEDEVV